jgi:superfamily II DNA or RNA helicase
LIERELGEPVTVAHSDDPEASLRIERFARSRQRWLVAVNMVSEGVDIPRLRVGVYASMVKTPLFFRQVIGRFVRTIKGEQTDPSYLYIPGRSDAATARARSRAGDAHAMRTLTRELAPDDRSQHAA